MLRDAIRPTLFADMPSSAPIFYAVYNFSIYSLGTISFHANISIATLIMDSIATSERCSLNSFVASKINLAEEGWNQF